jgi:hypothetical protein
MTSCQGRPRLTAASAVRGDRERFPCCQLAAHLPHRTLTGRARLTGFEIVGPALGAVPGERLPANFSAVDRWNWRPATSRCTPASGYRVMSGPGQ